MPNREKKAMPENIKRLWIALFAILLAGCAALTQPDPTRRIHPESAGIDRDISSLVTSSASYDVSYSGPVYNPSSLIFIPDDARNGLRLAPGWSRVDNRSQLNELVMNINRFRPELWAIVPAGTENISESDVWAFHYTLERASIRKTDTQNQYLVLPVPEQNRAELYGR